MMRVLIWSRKTLSSEILAAAIKSESRFKSAMLIESEVQMLEALDDVDVLLMLPDPSDTVNKWTSTLASVRRARPNLRVILLMEKREPDLVVRAFTKGVRGVISLHSSSMDQLWKCIEKVHQGEIWANAEELEWVIRAFESGRHLDKPMSVVSASGAPLLSKREEDVVKLLVDGLQNREIAHALGLSEHTVKNYLFRIYDKLGISTRSELMLYVLTPQARAAS